MGHNVRKPVFRVSDKVRFKSACSAKKNSQKIEIALVESLDVTFQYSNNKGADQTADAQAGQGFCYFHKHPEGGVSPVEAPIMLLLSIWALT